MADMTMIARPYAKAAFELALAQGALAEWEGLLQGLGAIAEDARVQAFLMDPRVTAAQRGQFFIDVCGEHLDEQGARWVNVLSAAGRLLALPAILSAFRRDLDAHAGVSRVEVVSARALSTPQQKALKDRLTQRLQQAPELSYSIDERLLGGLVVRMGDRVIDGSVQGRVERLNNALLQ